MTLDTSLQKMPIAIYLTTNPLKCIYLSVWVNVLNYQYSKCKDPRYHPYEVLSHILVPPRTTKSISVGNAAQMEMNAL